ncbi:MAG: polysulfide reductase NrfD [Gemmatimonadetes bacterium]|nr:polysulfide reductase NrfD [Gemmatimonadota bacterium]
MNDQTAPPVKTAPWEWYYVPAYFWLGGIAGGSWVAAALEELAGRNDRGVVRAGRYVAVAGALGGTVLLILDLGRPERFLHMLRIVRARSPMSLGSWTLTAFGGVAGAAAALQWAEDVAGSRSPAARISRGWPGRALHLLGLPLALFVASYTGALLAATSTPTWARRAGTLPPLFLASGLSTGMAAVSLALRATGGAPSAERRLARAQAAALAAELVFAALDHGAARRLPSAAREPTAFGTVRKLTLLAGMVVPLLLAVDQGFGRKRREGKPGLRHELDERPVRSRNGLLAAGLALAGGLALRLLVTHEGKRSAHTPEDTWAFAAGRVHDGREIGQPASSREVPR